MKDLTLRQSKILFYTSSKGDIKIEVFFQDETVWLTINRMAELFNTTKQNISLHLKNIFKENELNENSVVKESLTTASDGKQYQIKYYNLDAIIAVGYRVNSKKATQFRIWATKTLRNYIIKGFVVDKERLKNGSHFGKDYFNELLEKIREIRASERRFYQKITDIYTTSVGYDPRAKITKDFFSTVQNKLHWAITKQTAAEIIAKRADAKKSNMGLTSWKNSPKGKILKSDVTIAKNYLVEKEIKELNLVVNMYLDYAELQANKQILMEMKDWIKKLNIFLEFNEYEILDNPGKVPHKVAKKLAEKEYKKFRIKQDKDYISDFDRETKKILIDKST